MGFLEDVLNGGLDRDFDGDIDRQDRDIMEFEEIQREQEEILREQNFYSLTEEGFENDDYYDEDEFDEDEEDFEDDDLDLYVDYDDYDDFDDYSYCGYSGSSSLFTPKTEREKIIDRVPVYEGIKGKKDVAVVEWENMSEQHFKKTRGYLTICVAFFIIAVIGASVFMMCMTEGYNNSLLWCGFWTGLIGGIICIVSFLFYTDYATCYTHVNDENGKLIYRSRCSLDKELKEYDDLHQGKESF